MTSGAGTNRMSNEKYVEAVAEKYAERFSQLTVDQQTKEELTLQIRNAIALCLNMVYESVTTPLMGFLSSAESLLAMGPDVPGWRVEEWQKQVVSIVDAYRSESSEE